MPNVTNITPHCTRYCVQTRDGKVWHVHGNAKRKRFRKKACKCDMCQRGRLRWRERRARNEDW